MLQSLIGKYFFQGSSIKYTNKPDPLILQHLNFQEKDQSIDWLYES